jgi:propanol-preferring alcohol dehydrogenase
VRFFQEVPVKAISTQVTSYALENANEALADLRAGKFNGAAVIDLNKRQD